ncbi:carboxypeptidase-like regulatory domain-containing protein [bacterium]|nr:carboxypeptidase-like regulatory domain-containing protein [bacterium]
MIRTFLCILTILLPVFQTQVAVGQQIPRARIEGVVLQSGSSVPISDVHIFISRSSIGTTSTSAGTYNLTLPVGAHRIVVSRVGFQTQVHDVMIRESRAYSLNFELDEEVLEMEGLTISAVRNRNWDKQLDRFKEAFLGLTENADSTFILNAEILSFKEENGRFTARADAPLQLVNRALGYEIEHHLHHFMIQGDETWQDGESAFTPLKPTSEQELAYWEGNRMKAYLGSSGHFFQSVVNNMSRQEGFQAYLVGDPINVGNARQSSQNFAAPMQQPEFAVNPYVLLETGQSNNEHSLSFAKFMLIVFTRERESEQYAQWQKVYHSGEARDLQYSWVTLRDGVATLDSQGNVLDPYAFSFFGYMSFERLADLMPKEYRPR